MIGLVLVTHGRLAEEFRSAMEHVVGPQAAIETVTIGPDDRMEARRADIAAAVARPVALGEAHAGIVIDGAGLGSAIAANKIAGVRCALCHDDTTVLTISRSSPADLIEQPVPHEFGRADWAGRLKDDEIAGGDHRG